MRGADGTLRHERLPASLVAMLHERVAAQREWRAVCVRATSHGAIASHFSCMHPGGNFIENALRKHAVWDRRCDNI